MTTIMVAHIGISITQDCEDIIQEVGESFTSWFAERGYSSDTFTAKRCTYKQDMLYPFVEIYLDIHPDDVAAHFMLEHAHELPLFEFWNSFKHAP